MDLDSWMVIEMTYDKEKAIASLHKLVRDIQKEWPDENIWVDESVPCIIWGKAKQKQFMDSTLQEREAKEGEEQ